jgi:hypothetical protein
MTFTATLDTRFSDPAAEPVSWDRVDNALAAAELYWLSTVRTDGRPHVTPLVGLWVDHSFVFCTGPAEQKALNLQGTSAVAVTTGANTWKDGLDVVVEGTALRVTGRDALQRLADGYLAKYGGDWTFDVDDDVFDPAGMSAIVLRVNPAKVLAFAKSPHGQTTFVPQK